MIGRIDQTAVQFQFAEDDVVLVANVKIAVTAAGNLVFAVNQKALVNAAEFSAVDGKNVAVTGNIADDIGVIVVNVHVIQGITDIFAVFQDRTAKLDFSHLFVFGIKDARVRADPPQKIIVVIESKAVFEQLTDGYAGFGIDIVIGLHVADKLVGFVDDRTVKNRAADKDAVNIHNRIKLRLSGDDFTVGIAQFSPLVNAAEQFAAISRYLSGRRYGSLNIAVEVYYTAGNYLITDDGTGFRNRLPVPEHAADKRFAIIADVPLRRNNTEKRTIAVDHGFITAGFADRQAGIVNYQTAVNYFSGDTPGRIADSTVNVRIAKQTAGYAEDQMLIGRRSNLRIKVDLGILSGFDNRIVRQNFGFRFKSLIQDHIGFG